MGSYPDEFPFGIMEVVNLLNLRIRRQQADSIYVDCPFCGDRQGRMNVNFVKNVWRCNYCNDMAECWRCMLNLTIQQHPMPTGRLQKLCVTISKRNTHAPGMKPNNGRPAHALQLWGPGLPLPVILLPSEKQ